MVALEPLWEEVDDWFEEVWQVRRQAQPSLVEKLLPRPGSAAASRYVVLSQWWALLKEAAGTENSENKEAEEEDPYVSDDWIIQFFFRVRQLHQVVVQRKMLTTGGSIKEKAVSVSL